MKMSSRVEYLLRTLGPGELQYGVVFSDAKRTKTEKGFDIVPFLQPVKGTGIPASTLAKIIKDPSKAGPRSLAKLEKMYGRYAYRNLKTSGASKTEAARFRKAPPEKMLTIASEYRRHVKTIALNKKVPELAIQWGMNHSERKYEDWTTYVAEHEYEVYEDEDSDYYDSFQEGESEEW